jgi:hypothetical protein
MFPSRTGNREQESMHGARFHRNIGMNWVREQQIVATSHVIGLSLFATTKISGIHSLFVAVRALLSQHKTRPSRQLIYLQTDNCLSPLYHTNGGRTQLWH